MNTTPHIHALRTVALIAALLFASSFGLNARADGWSLKDKDGVAYTLPGLHGKWVLVNFWAPWCPSCIQEMPDLDALQKQHKDLQVIGVAVMYRSKKEVMELVKKQTISYPVVFGNEDIASDFGSMTGMPTSFLYSPAGKLIGHHEGPLDPTEVEQALNGNNTFFTP